jgi:hypothetical protein
LFVLASEMGSCVDLNQSELTGLEEGEDRDRDGWKIWSRQDLWEMGVKRRRQEAVERDGRVSLVEAKAVRGP